MDFIVLEGSGHLAPLIPEVIIIRIFNLDIHISLLAAIDLVFVMYYGGIYLRYHRNSRKKTDAPI